MRWKILYSHDNDEVFIELHGPKFRGVLRSSNHLTLTRGVVDCLLLKEIDMTSHMQLWIEETSLSIFPLSEIPMLREGCASYKTLWGGHLMKVRHVSPHLLTLTNIYL